MPDTVSAAQGEVYGEEKRLLDDDPPLDLKSDDIADEHGVCYPSKPAYRFAVLVLICLTSLGKLS